jgi:arachidonate 5-lipoxygenase
MYYTIEITTGDRGGADASGHAGITIVGTQGRLDNYRLDHRQRFSFRRNQTDRFDIQADDLGKLLYLEVYVPGKPWFVNQIRISSVGSVDAIFPCYSWITRTRQIVLEGTAALPSDETEPELMQARAAQLEQRRQSYQFVVPDNGLPPHNKEQNMELLPLNETFTEERDEDIQGKKKQAEINLKAAYVHFLFDHWDERVDEEHLYSLMQKPDIMHRLNDDISSQQRDLEFAYQMVASVAPNHIKRINTVADLPEVWADAIDTLERELGPLEAAANRGALFAVDDKVLDGIPMFKNESEQRYAPPATCLFTLEGKNLKPVAVRMSAGGQIFKPSDGDAWHLALTYFATAEANVHQIVTHALRTHLVIEPYTLATMRCLSSRHPVYKLMLRHFQGTIRINAEARTVLLASGGVFDEFIASGGPDGGHIKLAKRAYEAWTLGSNDIEQDLRERGFGGSTDQQLSYPYAEDARDLSEAIREYVNGTLALYYQDDASVAADSEISAWFEEIKRYGKPGALGDAPTLANLQNILRIVIFTGSVQHTAVNFGQYQHFGFVPNAPASMRVSPPTNPEATLSEAQWMAALPDYKQTFRQIAVSYSLSRFVEDEEYLLQQGGWRASHFIEASAQNEIDAFHTALRTIEGRIEQRNRDRLHPYKWLLPTKVPTSISI